MRISPRRAQNSWKFLIVSHVKVQRKGFWNEIVVFHLYECARSYFLIFSVVLLRCFKLTLLVHTPTSAYDINSLVQPINFSMHFVNSCLQKFWSWWIWNPCLTDKLVYIPTWQQQALHVDSFLLLCCLFFFARRVHTLHLPSVQYDRRAVTTTP